MTFLASPFVAAGASILGGLFSSGGESSAAREAAQIESRGAEQGIAEQRRQFDVLQGLFAPQVEAGDLARQQQLALLGLGGEGTQEAAFGQFAESPGQQFIRERQQRALVRNASAIGGLGGGNVRTALQEQAAGFASQDFGNQFNRLASLSGGGQVAAQNLGQFGTAASGNITNLLGQQASAQAGGVLGAQQGRAGDISNLVGIASSLPGIFGGGTSTSPSTGFFSDRRLKTDIKKIGRLGDFNLYEWTWIETGLKDRGYMADEIQAKYPDLVSTVNGFLSVIYDKVIGRQYASFC